MRGTTLPLELHQYRIASNYIAQETALTVTPLNHLLSSHCLIFTVRNRSLRGLCFHRCLYVHRGCLCPERGPLSGGCLSGGVFVQGVSVRETPHTVRILLECILVSLVCFGYPLGCPLIYPPAILFNWEANCVEEDTSGPTPNPIPTKM